MDQANDNQVDGNPTWSLIWIALLFVFVAALRIAAQSDLHEGDQPKQADYVLDIICNGNWTVQHDADGWVMSKPPLYNWLAAPLVMLFGANDVFLKMPSLLAAFAAALMTWDLARRRLGERAALWGTVFMLLTSIFEKQMYYARTDMLLTCFIVMQFWAIVRWEDDAAQPRSLRSGWVWLFWIAAALGNLTKGPLAFLPQLALALLWLYEGRFKERCARLGVWWGLPLAILPVAIWFACAYAKEGHPIYERMIKAEVVDRFRRTAEKMADEGADKSNRNFFYYVPLLISRTLPWSLFALVGIWSVFTAKQNPQLNDRQRGMLRFLAAWFLTTLLFFSLILSKRADRIFPAVPAFCLLAGWAFNGFLQTYHSSKKEMRSEQRVAGWLALTVAAVFLLTGAVLIGLEFGAQFWPFETLRQNLTPGMPEALVSNRVLSLATAALLVLGGILTIVSFVNKRPIVLALSLVCCMLALIVLYQQALGNWMQTDFCLGASGVCREVRKRAQADGAKIMIIAGSGPAARFYLLQHGFGIPAKDAKIRLAQAHPALYVVGTQPFIEVEQIVGAKGVAETKRRMPGGLEAATLAGARPIKVEGVPLVEETVPLSTIKWLGAVYMPERK